MPIYKLILFTLLLAAAAACSLVGLDDDDGPPFPTEIVYDGLRFRLEPSEVSGTDISAISLTATNIRDTIITRGWEVCAVMRGVAYREGDWGEPVWRENEVPFLGACTPMGGSVPFEPGEPIQLASWRRDYTVTWVLGDSLEGGAYRFAADVLLDFRDSFEESLIERLVAPNPVRLE